MGFNEGRREYKGTRRVNGWRANHAQQTQSRWLRCVISSQTYAFFLWSTFDFPFDVSRTMFHKQHFVSWWIRAEFMNDGWLPLKWYGDANVARPTFECILSHERWSGCQRQKIDEIFRSCLMRSLFILSICRAIYVIKSNIKKRILQQK